MQDYQKMIVSNPHVMMGKPVIAGTRVTVELILEKLAAGESIQQILDAYPRTVLAESRNSASVLITADRDFGELVFRNRQVSAGVLLIRLLGLRPAVKADLVSNAIREHAQELPGAFTVLSPGSIRVRRPIRS